VTTAVEPLLLNADQAAALCGVSSATWYRMSSAGRCPAPLRLSAGCVRWRVEELRDWIAVGCPSRREWEARRAAANGNVRPRQAGR
jgi:predicted DNA-binding transcriptional regulator AlpA